jgi:transposase
MFAGYSWQEAVAQSQLKISRAMAYRLRQMACDEEKAERAFLDDRHGHPSKLTEPAQAWLAEFCTPNPQIASSRVQTELKTQFGLVVSVSQINRVRAKLGVSRQPSGSVQAPSKKN